MMMTEDEREQLSHEIGFKAESLETLQRVVQRLQEKVEDIWQLPPNRIHLTRPTFFSRIQGDKEAKTTHDEYWHEVGLCGGVLLRLHVCVYGCVRVCVGVLRALVCVF